MISAAAALCMVLPLCSPIMADAAVPENAAAPVVISSAASGRSLQDELSKNGNMVTEYVNQEDNETKTIVWAKGVIPPKMGDEDSDFVRTELATASGTYVTYEAPYQSNHGWYDVNKTGAGDLNLCFAAAAANSLHWWMDRNSDYIDRYLVRNPNDPQIQKLHGLRHSFESQSKSGVFDIFLHQFAYRPDGYWSDILQDQFINGYYLKANMGTHDSPADREKLLKDGPDPHGGFFYKVFGTDLLSARRQYDNGYAVISNELKDCFMRGDLVLMSFRVNNLQSHVVTLWGAEYDQNGKLSGVYFSDSDDRESVGMQRYMVFDVGGKAVVSTRVKGAADRTNAIESLLILSPGTAQWKKYFENDKKTLNLVWSNTEYTYDGKPHTPTVTATNLDDGEQVELIVKGEGINAGSYTATVDFKDGYSDKYKLPEHSTCQFQIKKAAAPVIHYPEASALQYGQILAESTLSGGDREYGDFVWANSGTVPAAGQQSCPVLFIPSQTTRQNYEPVQNTEAQVTVQVAKAVSTVTLNAEVKGETEAIGVNLSAAVYPAGYGKMPSGSISFTILDENGQSVESVPIQAALNGNGTATAVWKPAESKKYTIKATYTGDHNYEPVSAEMTVNVSQQSQQPIMIHPIETKTYGDRSFEIRAEGGSGNGAFTFSSSAPDVISVNNSTATIHKAGTAVITVTKAADGLFAPTQTSIPVTVEKKALTVTAENKLDVLQGEQLPAFTYKVEGLVNGDQFSDPVLTAVAQDTDIPGEYEITVKGGQLTNAESYSVTYVSGKLTVLPKEVPPTPTPEPMPTPEPEAPGEPATPENPAPSVIQPMPEDVTTVPDSVEKIEQDHKQEEKEQTEEVSAEKQESASGTKPEAEKNSLPESTSDSVSAESTVTATQNNTGSTVAKVVAGTAAALVAIAGGVFIFRKRKERKK